MEHDAICLRRLVLRGVRRARRWLRPVALVLAEQPERRQDLVAREDARLCEAQPREEVGEALDLRKPRHVLLQQRAPVLMRLDATAGAFLPIPLLARRRAVHDGLAPRAAASVARHHALAREAVEVDIEFLNVVEHVAQAAAGGCLGSIGDGVRVGEHFLHECPCVHSFRK